MHIGKSEDRLKVHSHIYHEMRVHSS